MGSIHTGKAMARYTEPKARGIQGCHDCRLVQMQPSMSGPLAPYCPRLGCSVKELSICERYEARNTQHIPIIIDERKAVTTTGAPA